MPGGHRGGVENSLGEVGSALAERGCHKQSETTAVKYQGKEAQEFS